MIKATTLGALALFALSIATTPAALADDTMDGEAAAVWSVIAESWADETQETGAWPAEYLHADAHAWERGWPAPRSADSIASWSRFAADHRNSLKYELFPMKVNVSGEVAVAYYSVVHVVENHEGKAKREVSGMVETLLKTADGWKFLNLSAFNLGDDD